MSKDDPLETADVILLQRCRRALGQSSDGIRAFDPGEREEAELSAAERKQVLATLSELAEVLALMVARKDELKRQLDELRARLAGVSAYVRVHALTGKARRQH